MYVISDERLWHHATPVFYAISLLYGWDITEAFWLSDSGRGYTYVCSDGRGIEVETCETHVRYLLRKVKLGDGQPYAMFDMVNSLPLDAVFWRMFTHLSIQIGSHRAVLSTPSHMGWAETCLAF